MNGFIKYQLALLLTLLATNAHSSDISWFQGKWITDCKESLNKTFPETKNPTTFEINSVCGIRWYITQGKIVSTNHVTTDTGKFELQPLSESEFNLLIGDKGKKLTLKVKRNDSGYCAQHSPVEVYSNGQYETVQPPEVLCFIRDDK
ncbi:hypothetical protein [Thalassotalea crassostreae]|nr:hypothetical protein [Thalassotalea crassostreae]